MKNCHPGDEQLLPTLGPVVSSSHINQRPKPGKSGLEKVPTPGGVEGSGSSKGLVVGQCRERAPNGSDWIPARHQDPVAVFHREHVPFPESGSEQVWSRSRRVDGYVVER